MSVELIVLDVDGGDMLLQCLASIELQTVKPERVIIVDNGSDVPVERRIGRSSTGTLVLRSERNLGFTGGINMAMSEVRAEFVGWINNDVELDPEWLSALLSEMQKEARLAAVQPLIMRPDGLLDGAGITVTAGRFLQIGHGCRIEEDREEPWGVSATASLYRTAALRDAAVGGAVLDPSFFAYYEDVELCARLRKAEWQMRVLQRPLAVHAGSASANVLGSEGIQLRTRNRYWVVRRHGVGRVTSLLAEDLRLLARGLLGFRLGRVLSRLEGMIRGLFASPGRKLM